MTYILSKALILTFSHLITRTQALRQSRSELTHEWKSRLRHTKAKRHYGRHSLGFVLLIVSTGLNVSGQLYLHIAE